MVSTYSPRRILERSIDPKIRPELILKPTTRVSYDDGETLEIKKQFANNRCLGGTMIWALDLDEPGSPTLHALANAKAHNNIGDLLGDDFPMPIRLGAVVDEKIREQDEVALVSFSYNCRLCWMQ